MRPLSFGFPNVLLLIGNERLSGQKWCLLEVLLASLPAKCVGQQNIPVMADFDKHIRDSYLFSLYKQRLSILRQMESWLETPLIVLSAVWIVLIVIDFGWGLNVFGEIATAVIWGLFIFDFLLRFTVAPRKTRYLARNWLTALSLLLPALRIFRVARLFRVLARLRALQLVRILGSLNRGMRALGKTMRRRGFGYIMVLTTAVTIVGAAGMFYFERALPDGQGMDNFYTALWWTAMLMTTMGSEYWPKTAEGRALCLFLSIYAFAVFGYVTGVIATFFIGRDAAEDEGDVAGRRDFEALRQEIRALREEIRQQRDTA